MKPKSVIVVGAGIGGSPPQSTLPEAGCTSRSSKKTRPGGRCDQFGRPGHHFGHRTHPVRHAPAVRSRISPLGASLHERLDLLRVDPTYHLVFDDGSQLALTSDMKSMQEQLETIQPGSFQGLLRYLQEGDRHYRLVLDKLVNRDFRKPSDFFNLAEFASDLSAQTADQPLSQHVCRF